MASSSWWYGVGLFPVVLLTTVISQFGYRTLIAVSTNSDLGVGVGILSFFLAVVPSLIGVSVGLVVVGCLIADIRMLSGSGEWSPSIGWVVAGVVHLLGTELPSLLVLSTPALTLYLYQRHLHIGTP